MSPKEEAQNSAQRKKDYTAARTNTLLKMRTLKTSKGIPYCERNGGFVMYYCYLPLTVLHFIGEIIVDGTS